MIKFVRLAAGQCFSQGTPVSSTNKTYRHDITEILLKVALNIIPPLKNYHTWVTCAFNGTVLKCKNSHFICTVGYLNIILIEVAHV
jgi:hypothetical protein